MRPVLVTPTLLRISTGWRPRWHQNTSSRVSAIFTGRPVSIAIFAAATSWLNGSLLPPKPPPFWIATTRMWCAGSGCSVRASARCR